MPHHYIKSVDDLEPGNTYILYQQDDASESELLPKAVPERRLPAIRVIADEAAMWFWEQSETGDAAAFVLMRVDNSESIPAQRHAEQVVVDR